MIIYAGTTRDDRTGPGPSPVSVPEQTINLDVFLDNWNQYAEPYSNHYKIVGDQAASSQAIVGTVYKWTRAFYRELPQGFEQQLADFSLDSPTSTFHEYAQFHRKYFTNQSPQVHQAVDSSSLAHLLNQLGHVQESGLIPDYLTPETVKAVIYMNDFCAFFISERESLHQKGIDTNIDRCSDVGTNGKYPALDALVSSTSPFYQAAH